MPRRSRATSRGSLGTAIASAPLVLLCYASPTLCDAYKHFKQMASEVLSLRAGECRAVEQAAANLGTSLNRQQQLACIDERIAARRPELGRPGRLQGAEPDDHARLHASRGVGEFKVVESALQASGADAETAAFAKALLGDVRFAAGDGAASPGVEAAEGVWGRPSSGTSSGWRRASTPSPAAGRSGPARSPAISVPGVPVSELCWRGSGPCAGGATARDPEARGRAHARAPRVLLQATEDQLRQAAAHPTRPSSGPPRSTHRALQRAQARFRALKQNADT